MVDYGTADSHILILVTNLLFGYFVAVSEHGENITYMDRYLNLRPKKYSLPNFAATTHFAIEGGKSNATVLQLLLIRPISIGFIIGF